jgi:hypothetical protein
MQRKEHTLTLAEEEASSSLHRFLQELSFFLGAAASILLPLILSFFVGIWPRGSEQRWSFFIWFLLAAEGGIIVGLAMFEKRRNRDVVRLGRTLARIYLSALRKSAFNPQLESTTPHD